MGWRGTCFLVKGTRRLEKEIRTMIPTTTTCWHMNPARRFSGVRLKITSTTINKCATTSGTYSVASLPYPAGEQQNTKWPWFKWSGGIWQGEFSANGLSCLLQYSLTCVIFCNRFVSVWFWVNCAHHASVSSLCSCWCMDDYGCADISQSVCM